jgi:hypothetical protein
LTRGKVTGAALGKNPQVIQSTLEDGQQPVNPKVRSLLTQLKEFGHDDLQGIRFEIDENKEQFLFRERQHPLAASSRKSLPGVACEGLLRGKQPLILPRCVRSSHIQSGGILD